MTNVFVDNFGIDASFQLMGDESVTQIVNFDVFQIGFFEVSINGSPNISD